MPAVRQKLHLSPCSDFRDQLCVTLKSLTEQYHDFYLLPYNWHKRKKSYENEEKAINAFLGRRPDLCRKPFLSLTTKDIQEYVDKQISEGVESSTLRRNLINPFRHITNRFARRELGYALPDPFRDVVLPDNPPHRDRVLTEQERLRLYVSIFEGCRGRQQKLLWVSLVIAALNTALRRIQLFKLLWKDIDFEKRTLWAYPTKREKQGRRLPLSKQLCTFLKAYYDRIPEEKRTPNSKVFPMTGTAHEQAWKRIVKRAKLYKTREDGTPDYLHFADLRHTVATAFRSQPIGLTAEENDYMLGHKTNRMGNRYEHLPLVENIRAKLDAADERYFDNDHLRTLDADNVAILKLFEPYQHPLRLSFPQEWERWEEEKKQSGLWQWE